MAKYAQGKFQLVNPQKYAGNKTPTYRSSWEFTFMQFCDNNPSVLQWASEAVHINYRNPLTGKNTIYVPDFLITYIDATGTQHLAQPMFSNIGGTLSQTQLPASIGAGSNLTSIDCGTF